MEVSEDIKKIFISYSWTTPEHEKWVLKIGTRLMEDGVMVILDKWELKEGHDKFAFMEKMVTDETLDKVLIICDKGYKTKADQRVGGAGIETQIIVPEVYNRVDQNKFIPIIREKEDHNFEAYMPVYMKGRIAIDFSQASSFEDEYEKLIRLIYDKPLYRKPQLGKAPSYLSSEKKSHFKTSKIIKEMENSIFKYPERTHHYISDFIEAFKKILNDSSIENIEKSKNYDDVVFDNIKDLKDLRDDYISFLSLIIKSKIEFDIDIIKYFFEDLYSYTYFKGNGSYYGYQFDHYKFLITELFIYTIAILLENESYKDIYFLTQSEYFLEMRGVDKELDFSYLRFYVESLGEERNRRLGLNKINLTAQILVERANHKEKCYKKMLLDTDLILFYISAIKNDNKNSHSWFPVTYIYRDNYKKLDILKRMTSKKHFDKVKIIFGIDSKEKMIETINKLEYKNNGYASSFDSIPTIESNISIDKIATNL